MCRHAQSQNFPHLAPSFPKLLDNALLLDEGVTLERTEERRTQKQKRGKEDVQGMGSKAWRVPRLDRELGQMFTNEQNQKG